MSAQGRVVLMSALCHLWAWAAHLPVLPVPVGFRDWSLAFPSCPGRGGSLFREEGLAAPAAPSQPSDSVSWAAQPPTGSLSWHHLC